MDVGNIIKDARKGKLTQKELAEKLNVSTVTVQNWENGRSNPSFAMLDRIAEVLNFTLPKTIDDKFSIHLPMTERVVKGLIEDNVNPDELEDTTKNLIINAVQLDIKNIKKR